MDEALGQIIAGQRIARIGRVRDHFAAFGIDVSSLSDEELEGAVAALASVAAATGTSFESAFRIAQHLSTAGRVSFEEIADTLRAQG